MTGILKKLIRQTKHLILLEPLKITRKNRKKTYFYLFLLIVTAFFHYLYNDHFEGTLPGKLMDIILVCFLLNITVHLVKIIVLSSYRKRNGYHREHFDNLTIGISHAASIIFCLALIIVLLSYLNTDLIAFLTIFGLFFAGLSWTLKDYAVSTINGLILMFSRDLRINDYIVINNNMGIIRNITFMHTEIKTDEGNIIYIPNNIILGNEVINFSKAKTKTIMFKLEIPPQFFGRIREIHEKTEKIMLQTYPDIIEKVNITIGRIKTTALTLKFQLVLKRYTFSIEKEIKNFAKITILNLIYEKSIKKSTPGLPKGMNNDSFQVPAEMHARPYEKNKNFRKTNRAGA